MHKYNSLVLRLLYGGAFLFAFALISYLAWYNFPQRDDFDYELKTLKSMDFLRQMIRLYDCCGSRFGGYVFQVLFFQIDGFEKYKFLPPLIFLFFSTGLFFFFKGMFLHGSSAHLKLLCLFVLLYLSGMPDFQSAFFWATASVGTITETLFLIFMAMLLRSDLSNPKKWQALIMSLLYLIFINSGEAHLGTGLLVLAFLWFLWIRFSQVSTLFVSTLTVFTIFSLVIYMLSPGFYNRVEVNQTVVQSSEFMYLSAIKWAVTQFMQWALDIRLWLIIIFTLFTPSLVPKQLEQHLRLLGVEFKLNDIVLLLIPVGLFSMTAGFQVILGNVLPDRTLNFFYMGLLFWSVLLGWRLRSLLGAPRPVYEASTQFLLILLVLGSFGAKYIIPNNLNSILNDIIQGNPEVFYASQQHRLQLIERCETDTCYLPPLKVYPTSYYEYYPLNELLTEELMQGKEVYFINEYYKYRYNKQAVFLESNDTLGFDYYYNQVWRRN